MIAEDVLDILEAEHHQGEGWHFFREMRLGVGFGRQSEQRLDAWAMNTWKSSGLKRVTYEVKVARADWRKELKMPTKRRMGLMLSNQFYFVAPVGMLKLEEVPPECGLIEILSEPDSKGRRSVVTHEAPWRDCLPFTWTFGAMLVRRVVDASEVGKLTKQVRDLQALNLSLKGETQRMKERLTEAVQHRHDIARTWEPETPAMEAWLTAWLETYLADPPWRQTGDHIHSSYVRSQITGMLRGAATLQQDQETSRKTGRCQTNHDGSRLLRQVLAVLVREAYQHGLNAGLTAGLPS